MTVPPPQYRAMATQDAIHSVRALTQPRTSQACKRCRSLKARCLPSKQQATCQRCLNSNRDCVWPEVQQRSKLTRGPSRISQVEKKIDRLVARIADTHTSDRIQTSENSGPPLTTAYDPRKHEGRDYATPSSTQDHSSEHYDDEEEEEHPASSMQELADMHDFDSVLEGAQANTCPAKSQKNSGMDDQLSRSLLAVLEVESLFERYRSMEISFPFVPIDAKMTVQDLGRRKPMLLLAIMTAACWRDRKLQLSLEKRYRQELAQRLYIEPRKNIALLQSLLIYLAWYHLFLDPKFGSEVMIHTAIGLTAELKLDPQTMPRMLPGRDPSKRIRYGKEGQRALLGCYYLSSISASSLRTPTFFKLTRHMFECVQKLEQEAESNLDKSLALMIRTRHLDDQINDSLHPSGLHFTRTSGEQLMLQLNNWELSIKELKDIINRGDSHIALKVAPHYIEMEMYHSIFRRLSGEDSPSQSAVLNYSTPDILWLCLEAGRSYLDTLVSIPLDEYRSLPFPVWLPLPRILIAIAMLTTPSEHHISQWDFKAAKDRVRLDLFLESLCFRMQSLTTFKPPAQPQPDFFITMSMVLQSVGKWYRRMLSRDLTSLSPPTEASNTNQTSTWNLPEETNPVISQPVQPQLMDGFVYTPESASSYNHSLLDIFPQMQASLPPVMCPMMGMAKGSDFDLDQFMDIGFWGNDPIGCDMMDFDFPP